MKTNAYAYFREIFLLYHEHISWVFSLELPHRGYSNEYTKHVINLKKLKFASWPGTMINPQWLEVPMSKTNFYTQKDVRAIGVRLY